MQKIKKLFSGLFLQKKALKNSKESELENPLKLGRVKNRDFREKIAVKSIGGLLVVEVLIEQRVYNFLFDTGAFSVVPEEVVQRCKLPLIKESLQSVDAAGEEVPLRLYTLRSLKMGSLEFENFTVAADDFTKKFPLSCFGFDGIFGYNFLQALLVNLDYQSSVITLSDRFTKPQGAKKIALSFDTLSGPKFLLHFQDMQLSVAIDSGKNDGILLGEEKIKEYFTQNECESRVTRGLTRSSFHTQEREEVQEQFLLKNFSVAKKIEIASYPVEVDVHKQNIAGNSFLKLFNITLDFKNKQAYFRELSRDIIKKEFPRTFGFFTYYSRDKKLFISAITDDSPATRSSLEIGDRILSLNAEEKLNFKEKDYCEFLLSLYDATESYEAQESVELVIQRDSLIKRVMLNK